MTTPLLSIREHSRLRFFDDVLAFASTLFSTFDFDGEATDFDFSTDCCCCFDGALDRCFSATLSVDDDES